MPMVFLTWCIPRKGSQYLLRQLPYRTSHKQAYYQVKKITTYHDNMLRRIRWRVYLETKCQTCPWWSELTSQGMHIVYYNLDT